MSQDLVGILRELYGTENVYEQRRIAVARRYKAVYKSLARDAETKTLIDELKEMAHMSLTEGDGCVDIMEDIISRLEESVKP